MRTRSFVAGLGLVLASGSLGPSAGVAFAEVAASVSVGAGQRGDETYAGVEARLDAGWEQLRLGLAVRGQWDDGRWREDDFTTAAGLGAVLRYLEAWHRWDDGEVAAALGALRPAAIGRVSDGVQVSVDDRYHTGLRARGRSGALELGGEIDDLFAPSFFAAEAGWHAESWRATAAAAVGAAPWGEALGPMGDPEGELETRAAFELSLAHRFPGEAPDEAFLGIGAVGEPAEGAHAVGFAELKTRTPKSRIALRADLRLGTGTLGLAFGPFHRVGAAPGEAARPSSSAAGLGAGVGLRVERDGVGWLEASLRAAQDRPSVATAHAGLPLTSRAQAGAWVATDEARTLFAAEVRAFGRGGSFLAVEGSHLVRARQPAMVEVGEVGALDAGAPALGWSVIAWLGVSR